jgi:putative ABC transport system substrate-binding protein
MAAPPPPSSPRRRRSILIALCIVSLPLVPVPITAQPPAPYRVATLGADPTQVWDVFQRRLRELGYVEGRNLTIERRWSSGYEDRLPKLMADLLRSSPDVIVTSSMLSTDTRIEPAQCVPILAIAVAEPYGPCRTYPVARLSEAASAREVSATHFRLARTLVPSAVRFAVLTSSDRPYLVEYVKGLEAAAATAGLLVSVLDVNAESDLAHLAAAITREAPDVLLVGPRFLPRPDWRRQIVGFATSRGIPSVGSYVADGVVVAADYDWASLGRRAADFVAELLKGTSPSQLATGAPVKFEVIVDGRVAKSLQLAVPETVLSQADRVLN